ncbi:MAG: hypothetical protein MI919_11735 [Holophagales bacterium]|nr:hypothetical protein [Holophagales bacterium]
MDSREVLRAQQGLEEPRVEHAVFGAMAVNPHGLVRATDDLDLFGKPERELLGGLKRALRNVYDDPGIDEIPAEERVGECPAVPDLPEGSELSCEILTRLGARAAFSKRVYSIREAIEEL